MYRVKLKNTRNVLPKRTQKINETKPISQEKLGGTNSEMNNPLSNEDLQLKYQFIVNLTKVNKIILNPIDFFDIDLSKCEPSIHVLQNLIEALNQCKPPVYDLKTTPKDLDL